MTRAGRVVRGLWPDHNPLRRTSDRAEAGILAGLVLAFLLGAPLIALAAWQLAMTTSFTTTNAERAGWRPVPAQLITGAPFSYGYDVMVAARWRAPDGAEQHGRIRVPPGTRAGTLVTVWAGHTGLLGRGPLTPSQTRIQATFSAAMAVPCWGVLLVCTGALSRRLLDARRLAAWDADWAAVDHRGQAGANPGP
jgi:hypothetical protein